MVLEFNTSSTFVLLFVYIVFVLKDLFSCVKASDDVDAETPCWGLAASFGRQKSRDRECESNSEVDREQ